MRGQQNTFYCSKNAVFGKDYTAKASNSSDATPWLLINGEGGFFSDNAYYQVENFNREGKEDKNGNGEVLAFCKLDKFSSDNYECDAGLSRARAVHWPSHTRVEPWRWAVSMSSARI